MQVNLNPTSAEHEGTLTVGDRLTISGVAKVISVSTHDQLDSEGQPVSTTSAVLSFEETPRTAPA